MNTTPATAPRKRTRTPKAEPAAPPVEPTETPDAAMPTDQYGDHMATLPLADLPDVADVVEVAPVPRRRKKPVAEPVADVAATAEVKPKVAVHLTWDEAADAPPFPFGTHDVADVVQIVGRQRGGGKEFFWVDRKTGEAAVGPLAQDAATEVAHDTQMAKTACRAALAKVGMASFDQIIADVSVVVVDGVFYLKIAVPHLIKADAKPFVETVAAGGLRYHVIDGVQSMVAGLSAPHRRNDTALCIVLMTLAAHGYAPPSLLSRAMLYASGDVPRIAYVQSRPDWANDLPFPQGLVPTHLKMAEQYVRLLQRVCMTLDRGALGAALSGVHLPALLDKYTAAGF